MSRWSGRLITKTPVTPSGPAPTSSAPGVWTLPEVAYWQKQGRWPSASADPYWSYVSYLLGTTATNAAQNNTFLDSSANNYTITRNGNTTQGSLTPYGSLWSNYFDGNGDYLTLPSSSAFSIATSSTPFTIEAWVYPTAAGGCIFSEAYTGGGNVDISLIMNAASGVETNGQYVTLGYYNGAWNVTRANTPITLNTWTHVAAVFTGSTSKIFYNGVDVTAASPLTSWGVTGSSGNEWYVGKRWDSPGGYVNFFSGYISNFRFVNGTAVYTAAFTPPAAPLTAISGTSFLSCQNNRFIDNSSNALTITPSGNISATPFSPFVLAPPGYNTSDNGGSGYFDGSGDYLTSSGSTASAMGTGDFSFEAFVYWTSYPTQYTSIFSTRSTNNANAAAFTVGVESSGYVYAFSSAFIAQTSSGVFALNTWNHVVFTRSGTTARLFVNGVLRATGTNSQNFSDQGFAVGANRDGTEPGAGYVSNMRLVKGSIPTDYQTSSTTVGTTIFTPPTTPVTAISGTSILMNFTNAGVFDAAMQSDMETVGNAQVSTGAAKFGTTSVYFDGTGDWLTAPGGDKFQFGTGDFTIECWINKPSAGNGPIIDARGSAVAAPYALYVDGSNYPYFYEGTSYTSTVAITNNQWNHVAVTRSSGTLRIFVDGVQGYSGTVTTNLTAASTIYIGGQNFSSPATMTGYIDDLRITKGYARYTANFTPPTAALPVY